MSGADSPAALRSLYRALSRHIRSTTRVGTQPLATYVRETLTRSPEARVRLPFEGETRTPQILRNLDTFLRHKRTHAALLERYNPSSAITEEERIRLTARRVGLDVPLTYTSDSPPPPQPHAADNHSLLHHGAKSASQQVDKDRRRQQQLYEGKGDPWNRGGPLPPPVPKE